MSTTKSPSSLLLPPPIQRVARKLALAHYIERLIDQGRLRDYADAARRLGLTRARVSQVMDLLHLAPAVQASILSGELSWSERRLREVLRKVEWEEQETHLLRNN